MDIDRKIEYLAKLYRLREAIDKRIAVTLESDTAYEPEDDALTRLAVPFHGTKEASDDQKMKKRKYTKREKKEWVPKKKSGPKKRTIVIHDCCGSTGPRHKNGCENVGKPKLVYSCVDCNTGMTVYSPPEQCSKCQSKNIVQR